MSKIMTISRYTLISVLSYLAISQVVSLLKVFREVFLLSIDPWLPPILFSTIIVVFYLTLISVAIFFLYKKSSLGWISGILFLLVIFFFKFF
jgi:hypothetical protein